MSEPPSCIGWLLALLCAALLWALILFCAVKLAEAIA